MCWSLFGWSVFSSFVGSAIVAIVAGLLVYSSGWWEYFSDLHKKEVNRKAQNIQERMTVEIKRDVMKEIKASQREETK